MSAATIRTMNHVHILIVTLVLLGTFITTINMAHAAIDPTDGILSNVTTVDQLVTGNIAIKNRDTLQYDPFTFELDQTDLDGYPQFAFPDHVDVLTQTADLFVMSFGIYDAYREPITIELSARITSGVASTPEPTTIPTSDITMTPTTEPTVQPTMTPVPTTLPTMTPADNVLHGVIVAITGESGDADYDRFVSDHPDCTVLSESDNANDPLSPFIYTRLSCNMTQATIDNLPEQYSGILLITPRYDVLLPVVVK